MSTGGSDANFSFVSDKPLARRGVPKTKWYQFRQCFTTFDEKYGDFLIICDLVPPLSVVLVFVLQKENNYVVIVCSL